jgi:chondroitin 4-sulfotransferase 11
MIVSDNPPFVFIHVPKTGGTSVHRALQILDHGDFQKWRSTDFNQQHMPYHILLTKHPSFSTHFSFAFVRNPWDRVVSLSAFTKDGRVDKAALLSITHGFPRYWGSQIGYIQSGGRSVDFIGHFERIEHDFQYICQRIGIEATLPHLNRSNHTDYHDYYDDETRELVATKYARDIEAFGYKF